MTKTPAHSYILSSIKRIKSGNCLFNPLINGLSMAFKSINKWIFPFNSVALYQATLNHRNSYRNGEAKSGGRVLKSHYAMQRKDGISLFITVKSRKKNLNNLGKMIKKQLIMYKKKFNHFKSKKRNQRNNGQNALYQYFLLLFWP